MVDEAPNRGHDPATGGEVSPGALLLVVFLPVINAAIDWPSWAVSRRLMKSLAKEPHEPTFSSTLVDLLGHTVADLAVALGLLVLLAGVMPAAVVLFSSAFDFARWDPYPIESVIDTAAAEPFGRGLWVTMMLLSTLVPTLVHIGALVVAAVTCQLSGETRERYAELLEREEAPLAQDLTAVALFLVWRLWVAGLALVLVCGALCAPIYLGRAWIGARLHQVATASVEWAKAL